MLFNLKKNIPVYELFPVLFLSELDLSSAIFRTGSEPSLCLIGLQLADHARQLGCNLHLLVPFLFIQSTPIAYLCVLFHSASYACRHGI